MKHSNKEKVAKEFGAFIREERENCGLFQADVAAMLGISRGYYAHIEAGDRDIGFALALDICNALKLDINDFAKRTK